jgi:uncharacterized membrane protein HdeD (DUF308 family)
MEEFSMNEETEQMKPIWYHVGWVLMIIGVLVMAAGIYYLFFPVHLDIALHGMHISIWWGAVLILGGFILTYFNRKHAKSFGTLELDNEKAVRLLRG